MVMSDKINEEKFNDSYELLLSSTRVSKEVKHILKERLFIEQNTDTIISLARLLFLVDTIEIINDEIVARKKISLIKEPKIDIDDIIYKYLLKIKHNILSTNDINKLHELKNYPAYEKLYKLITLAIEWDVKIKTIDDKKLKKTMSELEDFLKNE